MTPEEQKFLDDITDKIKAVEETASKTATKLAEIEKNPGAKSDDVESLKTSLKTAEENLKTLQDTQEKMVETLKEVSLELKEEKKGRKTNVQFASMSQALAHAFTEKAEELQQAAGTDQKESFKVVITMGEGNTIGSGSTVNTLTENTNIISTIRKRELRYAARVSTGRIGNKYALWVEETDEQGTPIMLAEAAAKTKISVKYVEKTQAVQKIAVYGKVTTEMIEDLPQLIAYIENNLMKRQDIVVENQLISGDGTGNNLKGFTEWASAFSAPASLAAAVDAANEIDAMEAIALQVKLAFGIPDTIFVNPNTLSKIKLLKDTAGRPLWKDYVTIDGRLNFSGMDLIETTAITAGDFAAGDMSVVQVRYRSEMGITIGLDGNDFTENLKTILVEKRLVQFVSANDTGCIIYDQFADVIAAITAAP